jgi:hypothetical protein
MIFVMNGGSFSCPCSLPFWNGYVNIKIKNETKKNRTPLIEGSGSPVILVLPLCRYGGLPYPCAHKVA